MVIFPFLLLLTGVAAHNIPSMPPALVWGAIIPKPPNIFEAIQPVDFAKLIEPLQENYMVIVYFAPQLTSKDLTCLESGCFAYLRSVHPLTYYSQLYQPLEALEYLFQQRGMSLEWTDTYEMSQLSCQKHKLVAYDFADDNVKDHDSFMSAVADILADCSLVQIYTAHAEQIDALQRRLSRANAIMLWEKSANRTRHKAANKKKKTKDGSDKKAAKPVVLRDIKCIISLQKIVFAEQKFNGPNVYYTRKDILLDEKTSSLRMGLRDHGNIKKGVNITIDTKTDSIQLELMHAIGNWHITGLYYNNFTFKARDLLFYSPKFSFCSSSITAYSTEGHRLTLISLGLDLILDAGLSALEADYVTKPCWMFDGYLTPALAEAIFIAIVLLSCFGLGITMFLEMGRHKRIATVHDPEPQMKAAS